MRRPFHSSDTSHSSDRSRPDRRREAGAVLAMVLILALLLSTAVVSFARRATVDYMIVQNREAIARADALARGGIRIATGLLLHDGAATEDAAAPYSSFLSLWAQLDRYPIVTPDGAQLRIVIRDEGAKLNLNALVPIGGTEEESQADPDAEAFLIDVLEKVIDELPLPPGDTALYDPLELARALIDYMDENEDSALGGFEADWYQTQTPPYYPADGPLLSVDELALVRGFDSTLVEALRPYVTVHPIGSREGINVNTAAPHVLSLLYHGSSGDKVLATEDDVRRILQERAEDRIVCHDTAADPQACVGLADVYLLDGGIYPPITLPVRSRVYSVTAIATVGNIRRQAEAVIDRVGDEDGPQLLSWRVQ